MYKEFGIYIDEAAVYIVVELNKKKRQMKGISFPSRFFPEMTNKGINQFLKDYRIENSLRQPVFEVDLVFDPNFLQYYGFLGCITDEDVKEDLRRYIKFKNGAGWF